jgi:hypothetical protein
LVETGISLIGTSTFWLIFRYKKAVLDPPPEKKPEPEKKPDATKATASAGTNNHI